MGRWNRVHSERADHIDLTTEGLHTKIMGDEP